MILQTGRASNRLRSAALPARTTAGPSGEAGGEGGDPG
jgi:hypothetical protein